MRSKQVSKYIAASALAFSLCGCASQPPAETSKEPPKQYQLHGQVSRVDPQAKTATINGDKVEGWMDAMSMEYPVKGDVSGLHPNDCIDATLFVQGSNYWLADVKPSQATPCVVKKESTNK